MSIAKIPSVEIMGARFCWAGAGLIESLETSAGRCEIGFKIIHFLLLLWDMLIPSETLFSCSAIAASRLLEMMPAMA